MDQSYYFPNPTPGPPVPGNPNEGPRPTVVHRLPQTGSLKAPAGGIEARRLLIHLLLLGFTILTTTGVGILWFFDQEARTPYLHAVGAGIVYSFTILTILAAHEMGHYIACCWYGVDATLPYFIPVPIPPVGTFGAFIKIRSPIPTRRALFDIGIAGPLAGFVFAVPAAFIAHYFAAPAKPPEITEGMIFFNDPLLFQIFQKALHLPSMIQYNPVWWAAWVGVFMTSLNLLPVGQLDGGHITYAVFGPRGHRAIAIVSYLGVIALAIYSLRSGMWNWVVYGVILTLMLRVGHPPLTDDRESLGMARKFVAVIGLLVFILSFMPFPISF